MAFKKPSDNLEAYECIFLPQTIRDWNYLPDSLISSAEMSPDCVSKFASHVKLGTPPVPAPVDNGQFGVSPVSYSDSDTGLGHILP